jgi:elongator complex protein 5
MFGLDEEIEGILAGLESNDQRGVAIEMEHRRKSGRAVKEWFFLPSHAANEGKSKAKEPVTLLEDHPLYRSESDGTSAGVKEDAGDITFDLRLTEKQRKARDSVILPYFDAQSGQGPGEGGRILYDMGIEDDFDDEEDEV